MSKQIRLQAGATALVVGGKVLPFDAENPAHWRWLGVRAALKEAILTQGREQDCALYPPAFDEGVTRRMLTDWDRAHGGNGRAATTAWRVFWGLRQDPKGPLAPRRHMPADFEADVMRLGLLVGYSSPYQISRLAEKKTGLVSGQLWESYLRARGLSLGMDTTAWLAQRRAIMEAL